MQNVTDRRIYMHTTAMYRSVGVFKYLLRALGSQGRTCSSPVSPEIVRRRIWTVVDFPDNTVRQSLRQVPLLDTDHTACSSTSWVRSRED